MSQNRAGTLLYKTEFEITVGENEQQNFRVFF